MCEASGDLPKEPPFKTELWSSQMSDSDAVHYDLQGMQQSWCNSRTSSSDRGHLADGRQALTEPELTSKTRKDMDLQPMHRANLSAKTTPHDDSSTFSDGCMPNGRSPSDCHSTLGGVTGKILASTKLREMMRTSSRIIVCPGVYDGLSARIALKVGFDAMYMTGAGTTASRLGAADLGLAQLHDMRTNAEMIANLQPDGPPLIADMDTGYGGPMVIARAVQQYHLAGVAGFHIEDQVLQKRCGHLQGKEVVDIEIFIQRIKACKAAAKRLRSDIVIIARTDALQQRGYSECIERLRRARDEGADMGILEGVNTKEQAREAVFDLSPWPLCLNSVENGLSPAITVNEAQEMGYRAILFSFAALAPAYAAIEKTLEDLKDFGSVGSKVTPKAIFQVCGLSEEMAIDAAAGGSTFAKGV